MSVSCNCQTNPWKALLLPSCPYTPTSSVKGTPHLRVHFECQSRQPSSPKYSNRVACKQCRSPLTSLDAIVASKHTSTTRSLQNNQTFADGTDCWYCQVCMKKKVRKRLDIPNFFSLPECPGELKEPSASSTLMPVSPTLSRKPICGC